MYVSLLRLYLEISQQSLLLFLGLVVLLMASWGLIVSAIADIAIKLFDTQPSEGHRPSNTPRTR
jgi:hypothetical protein